MLGERRNNSSARGILFEETESAGSVAERLCFQLSVKGFSGRFQAVTLPDAFISQGKVPELLKKYKLDQASMEFILREEEAETCQK